jgi:hypothetical protein
LPVVLSESQCKANTPQNVESHHSIIIMLNGRTISAI